MIPAAFMRTISRPGLVLGMTQPARLASPVGVGAARWRVDNRAPEEFLRRVLGVMRSVAQNTDPEPRSAGGGTPAAATKSSRPRPRADRPAADPPGSALELSMEDLIRDHADAVYRVALSVTRDPMLAEDASQDALIKAWQALPTFRGESPLRNWILRITHNTAISLLRKRRDEVRDPDKLPDVVSHNTVEAQVQDRMAIDRFEVALRELDSVSRSIVVLREVEGLSYDEMCDVLQLPMPTIKTRLLRARRQLAVALDGWQP
jgi:RNA polymerase sigma-70 factor (ECF subfamily)